MEDEAIGLELMYQRMADRAVANAPDRTLPTANSDPPELSIAKHGQGIIRDRWL